MELRATGFDFQQRKSGRKGFAEKDKKGAAKIMVTPFRFNTSSETYLEGRHSQ